MTDREILFRGKRLDNRNWVCGSLISFGDGGRAILPSKSGVFQRAGKQFLATMDCCEVAPSTVSQYTGLTGRHGTRIFEGDIVKWGHVPGYEENPVRIAEVKITPDIQFDAKIGDRRYVFHYGAFCYWDCIDDAIEVIGNKWDNPELMGE